MTTTKYASLVEMAKKQRKKRLRLALEGITLDSLPSYESANIVAKELDIVNQHITVDKEDIKNAASDYEEIAKCLVTNLSWPDNSIRIFPQGSSSTQTLIKAPDASKFDIDAVCAVDISVFESKNPMAFFNDIGTALAEWEPNAKKRCWTINFSKRRYYVEFTPSAPLGTVPPEIVASMHYSPGNRYRDTALAVVDTPTEKWKTSNPEGFSSWVSDQAKRIILIPLITKSLAQESATYDSIDPVQNQEVPLSDTLRIAIRLLKRHRDMSVRKGYFKKEFKPISVIIVTLLTQCYEGLADQNSRYSDPIDLLIDLVELMPGMIEIRRGEYWIENPTIENENFAEKWNEKPQLRETFLNWCEILANDLNNILSSTDERSLRENLRTVFGCTGATTGSTTPPNSGLAPKAPNRVYNVPATTGLA